MFDPYNIGFSRGEAPAPRTPSASLALHTASGLVKDRLIKDYLKAMWELHELRFKGARFVTASSYMADIRDMGDVPSVMAALGAAEEILRAHRAGESWSLWDICQARQDAVKACRRPA